MPCGSFFVLPDPDLFFLPHFLSWLMIPSSSQRSGGVLSLHAHCSGLIGHRILAISPPDHCFTSFPFSIPKSAPWTKHSWTFVLASERVFLPLVLELFIHPPWQSRELSKLPSLSSWVKPFTSPETNRLECHLLGMAWKACQKNSSSCGAPCPNWAWYSSCSTRHGIYQPYHTAPSAWKRSSPPCNPTELSLNPRIVLTVPPPGSLLGPFLPPTTTSVTPWNFDPNSILVHFILYLQGFNFLVYLSGHIGSPLEVETISNSSLPPQQSSVVPGHTRYPSTTEVN